MTSTTPATASRAAAMLLCGWCVVVVLVEIGLFLSYRGHDARFHWFTHFFVGASTALLLMAVVTVRTRRPVPRPLVWPLVAHIFAMTPDLLFAGGIVHGTWMDVFLGHVSSHYVPGRNLSWYAIFVTLLACYLFVVDRTRHT